MPEKQKPNPVPEKKPKDADKAPREVGGRTGPEPTRYGDWEKGGIASDF